MQHHRFFARLRIPHACGVITAGGDNVASIRTEGGVCHFGRMSTQLMALLSGLRVPEARRLVKAGCDNGATIAAVRGEDDAFLMLT
jgi:hypothetical protein